MSDRWDYDNMFIDGAWTADDTVGVIKVIDPATEEAIGSVPEAGLKATRAAIAAARRAFDDGPWPRTSPRDRAKVLRRFAAILDERHNFLKKLVMAESGSVGFLADIIQVRGTIDIAEWIAEAMELAVRWTEVSPPAGGPTGMAGHVVVREPVGVVAAITPFNFPFFLNIVKVLPALAARLPWCSSRTSGRRLTPSRSPKRLRMLTFRQACSTSSRVAPRSGRR